MGCCFSSGKKEELKPLLGDQEDAKKTKTSKLEFVKLEVQEFDKVFGDFARALNPFVTDRERLEQAVTKFKTAVESLQNVHPQATFREYVQSLKTKLKEEGIFIKIKNGTVEVYGVAARSIKAVDNAVDAIKSIIAASQSLKDMPEMVTSASESSAQDVQESIENLRHIISREFPEVFDICKVVRFKKNLKKNLEKMRTVPTMVEDFCEEVKSIVEDISGAFDEDAKKDEDNKEEAAGSKQVDSNMIKGKEKSKNAKEKKSKRTEEDDKIEEDENKGKEKADKDSKTDKKKTEKDKKPDYHKQLKMDKVGLADIDRIFTDVMTTLNEFISTREKMQQARESFGKIMKTLCNFDGEKELKEYVKELKMKALEGNIHIYVDTTNDEIKIDSIKGVDPPAPYRNAVKALNDMKTAAKNTVDLEPDVLHDLISCTEDIAKIEPVKDFKKMVSGVKETMAIPKKVKVFNDNRKKVQQAPEIVKEFGLYVKQIVMDIINAFTEEDEPEKKDENISEKENGEEKERNKKLEVVAIVHTPRKDEKIEEENQNVVA